MDVDKKTAQFIIIVKELFMKNIGNSKKLSKLIDKYYEPTKLEKNDNAEIPTKYKLRKKSLNKIPS